MRPSPAAASRAPRSSRSTTRAQGSYAPASKDIPLEASTKVEPAPSPMPQARPGLEETSQGIACESTVTSTVVAPAFDGCGETARHGHDRKASVQGCTPLHFCPRTLPGSEPIHSPRGASLNPSTRRGSDGKTTLPVGAAPTRTARCCVEASARRPADGRGRPSDVGADLDELGEELDLELLLEELHARRPARARLVADDARDGLQVPEAPELEVHFEIDELLAHVVSL